MLPHLATRVLARVIGDDAPDLRVQIFRLGSFTTAVLSLMVVPANFVSHLPLPVHLATIAMGLSHLAFYAASRLAGRTWCAAFLLVSLGILDWVWFWNGGSQGSITYYFAPLLLFTLAVFRGGTRGWVVVGQVFNAGGLFVLEYLYPHWVTPFTSPIDRLLDHGAGIVSAAIATAAIGWMIIRSHAHEQKRLAELAARVALSEERYRDIFNSTSDALIIHGIDGKVLDLNDQACALFGLDRETARRVSFDDCSLGEPPFSAADAADRLSLALAGQPQTFEWLSRRYRGDVFWSEVAVRRATFTGQPCVISSVRDITARKQVQHELLANEERLRLAMLASRQGWFEINVQDGTGISSPEYPRLLGFDPSEFTTTVANWLEAVHPEDRDSARRELRLCIENGETRSLEYRRRTKDGSWKWIRSVGRIVERDAAGRPLRMVGMHTDITDRKELEAQLLHSQRLEAVGTLASGVAHDLNNILTPMLMGAGLLSDKLPDPGDREMMGMIETCGRRGAAIVKQLLAFSRAVTPERRPLAADVLMHEVAQLVRSTFPKEITVVEQIGECPHQIEADSTQLHQVLVNLAVNGRDAMPEGGTLTLGLEWSNPRTTEGPADLAAPESFLVFRVADTGHGIPAEIRDRIFDPFFTTKEPGKGTGLGLATVHGIVAAHRGFVRFESAAGRGTEFRVYIPVVAANTASANANARRGKSSAGAGAAAPTGAILVVDDEPAVLHTTQRSLERHGYRVLTAPTGVEALHVMEAHGAAIQLVITDFMMPEMDGPALVTRLRALAPTVTVIGMSGLDQQERAAELGLAALLNKPFDESDLLPLVQTALPRM